jgi:HEAT repeat protein
MNRQSSANLSVPTHLGGKANSEQLLLDLETALATLRTGDFQSRWDAAKVIPVFGEAAVAPLLELLESEASEETELLWFIAKVLGNLKHPAAVAALVQVLQSTEQSEVTTVAAIALANYGQAAIEPLTDLLSQPASRLVAVQALAQVQHAAVIQPLLKVANDASADVRTATIEALSHFYDPEITSALQVALQDPNTSVRRAAVVALGIQAEQGDRHALTEMLSPLLWDLNPEVFRQATIALARLGTATAIETLSQGLHSAHTPTVLQLDIVQALAWIGTVVALDPLRQFLEATSPTAGNLIVEQSIVTVLGRIKDLEAQAVATEILLNLLHHHHPVAQTPQGQQHIARSLGQLGDPRSIESLIQLLSEPDTCVQLHAIAALKQLEAVGSYQQLQALNGEANSLSEALKAGVKIALREWQAHADVQS